MSEYAKYALFLSMSEHGWILLNVPEHAWINCFDYVMVLKMLLSSYNNIIIAATNVMLGFLSVRYIHPVA